MSANKDAHEAARSSLRLTKSPKEFIPSSKGFDPSSKHKFVPKIPDYSKPGQPNSHQKDLISRQIPNSWQPLSPPTGRRGPAHGRDVSNSTNSSIGHEVGDPSTGCLRFAPELPREINVKEFREYLMPEPRPGSPNLDPEFDTNFAAYADYMLKLKDDAPPMEALKEIKFPDKLAAVYETDEAKAEQREIMMDLLTTPTPRTPEEALTNGIGPYAYRLMQMRDIVRRTIPDSTFPFFNGNVVDDQIQNYPTEVQQAFQNPAPSGNSQFIVVTFKHHRAEVFLFPQAMAYSDQLKLGEMVVVQADRGENVGQVWHVCGTMMEAEGVARDLNTAQLNNLLGFTRNFVPQAKALSPLQSNYKVQSQPGWIIRRAEPRYLLDLQQKEHDETKAKRIAAQKADDMGFKLEILDTEFQIDHQKLTIYYISQDYVRFKELVNNIYKIYKMRIWMSSINPHHPPQVAGGY